MQLRGTEVGWLTSEVSIEGLRGLEWKDKEPGSWKVNTSAV
jgi:hypothetical protein